MRILFLGDVYGKPGRDVIAKHLPDLKQRLKIDFVIVNGENAAHGKGITGDIAEDFYALGTDCITTGNHVWDQREIIPYVEKDKRILRPENYPVGTPGTGQRLFTLADGRKILVVNVMGRLFMDPMDCPFQTMDKVLKSYNLGRTVNAIFVDMHTETTSEKMAMGHYLDGRVSAVVGSHTHIPTADAHILAKGTAYMTDAGMCGTYDSVIGIKKEIAIERFVKKLTSERPTPAEGEGTLCGCLIQTDDTTGKALSIKPLRLDGILEQAVL